MDWLKYFLTLNPQLDWTIITTAACEHFWDQSVEQYGIVIGTDNRADQLITADGTIDYYKRVQQRMGGPDKTSQFARLFLARPASPIAPGALDQIPMVNWTHCSHGWRMAQRPRP